MNFLAVDDKFNTSVMEAAKSNARSAVVKAIILLILSKTMGARIVVEKDHGIFLWDQI